MAKKKVVDDFESYRTSLKLTVLIHKKLKKEANMRFEGNISLLVRDICTERYKLKRQGC